MRLLLTLLFLSTSLAFPQSEETLRQRFEGTTVIVTIDMPGSQEGVEVFPLAEMPVDFRKLASSIKHYGLAIRQGDSVMVSKVLIKKDHIEFQLGGGGFGTFSDAMNLSASTPTAPYQGKSNREKDIENQLKYENNDRRRRDLQAGLDRLQRQRTRDNNVTASINSQTAQQRKALERDLRARSGSRFNIRYPQGVPTEATTPEGIVNALAQYVSFSQQQQNSNPVPPPSGVDALHKGMTIAEVEQIFGPARTANSQQQGSLEVVTREYFTDSGLRISTQFVGGVLTDFTAKPLPQ